MKEQILDIIANQFDVDVDSLNEEVSFEDDLNADSIELMELIMNIEDELNIEIDEDEIANISTIGDVIEYVESL